MGYYCYFRLEIIDTTKNKILKDEVKHKIIQEIHDDEEMDPHGFSKDALNLDGESHNEAKWYDAEDHLAKISKNHPNLIFILGLEVCAPTSKEEEGEIFYAFQNGNVRGIHEPEFMKAPTLFKNRQALEDAAMVMAKGDVVDIIFRGDSKLLDLIFKNLKTTSFKAQTHTTFTFMSGGAGSSVTVQIKPEQMAQFWQEAERVLVG